MATFTLVVNGISEGDRVSCEKHADCGSSKLSCCRNGICCSSYYYQAHKTRCFRNEDCEGIKDHFSKKVMYEYCCNSKECCSEETYNTQPNEEKVDKHFKFRIIVLATIFATVILITTVVSFWCSSDSNRRRRRSFALRSRNFSSVFETSRDDNGGDLTTSYPAIVCDLKTIKETEDRELNTEEPSGNSENPPQAEDVKSLLTSENNYKEEMKNDENSMT